MRSPRLPALLATALLACGGAPRRRGPLPPLSRDGYARYIAGQLALVDGDSREAVAQLARAAAAQPDEPEIAVALARAQLRDRDLRGATTTAASATERWPTVPSTWRVRGEVAVARGDLALATTAFDRAVALAPDDELTYLALASAWTARGELAQADAALHRLLRALPTSIEGNWRLAQAATQADRPRDAERYLRAVLDAEPDHLDARVALAAALRARGDVAGAVAQSRQAFDRSGQHPALGEALIWMLCEHGDRQGALDVAALLDDDEASAATLLQVARVALTLGALPRARTAAAAAAVRAGADADADAATLADDARLVQAAAERAAGEVATARATLTPVAARTSDGTALLVAWMIDAGEVDAALALAREARDRRPDVPTLELALARARWAHGDGDASGDALARLVEAAPTDRERRGALATYLEETGAPARAAAVLAPLVAAGPDQAGPLNSYGYLLVEAGLSLPAAEHALRRARALAPGDPAVLDSWGWLRLRQGQVRLALRALRRAVALAPHEPELRAHLAEALDLAGQHAAAVRAWRRAAASAPPGAQRRRIEARAARAGAGAR